MLSFENLGAMDLPDSQLCKPRHIGYVYKIAISK